MAHENNVTKKYKDLFPKSKKDFWYNEPGVRSAKHPTKYNPRYLKKFKTRKKAEEEAESISKSTPRGYMSGGFLGAKKKQPVLPHKKPYTKEKFQSDALIHLKGISGGIDRTMMMNRIIEKGNKLRKQGVPRKEVVGIIHKANTAHGDWLRNYKTRERRKYFSK